MMKKNLILLGISVLTSLASYSQNVWSGTSTPTHTTGSSAIGSTVIPKKKLYVQSDNSLITSPSTWTTALEVHSYGKMYMHDKNDFIFRVTYQPQITPSVVSTYFGVNDQYTFVKNKLQIGDLSSITPYHDWKLSVDGSIMAKRLVIQVDKWADYVFAEDYKLAPLSEVSDFIAKNKHLPGVPSESEIVEKGLDVSHMNTILMQKVEELTLYMIEMQKENEALKKRVMSLETK